MHRGLIRRSCAISGCLTRRLIFHAGRICENYSNPESEVTIFIVVSTLPRFYKSLGEALVHGIANHAKVRIEWIDSELFEKAQLLTLHHISGILVPGGFGEQGSEGKIGAIQFARERKIPYLRSVLACRWLCLNSRIWQA